MPHSGGRVGKGIYFASENSKSAGYGEEVNDNYYISDPSNLCQSSLIILFSVRRAAGNIGIMFLNEVALGREHHITMGNSSLTSPPKGFDCIIAKGCTEPGKYPFIALPL